MMSRVPLLLVLAWCAGRCGGELFSVTFPEMRPEFQRYTIYWPFTNSNFHLPQSPSQQGITFRLYTPSNPTTPQILDARQASTVRDSNFNTSRLTVFIVHGFTDKGDNEWFRDMVNEVLKQGVNVVVVDWQNGAKGPNYYQATANTRVVGNHLATLLLTLYESLGVAFSTMHVVGHSLGAQVAGYAGQGVGGRLGRITGLDPAGPNFKGYDPRVRLDPSDAVFVDVIHTNAKSLVEGGLGTTDMSGDADYFPNGGADMPGCPEVSSSLLTLLGSLLTGNFSGFIDQISCSHMRAVTYFTASINSKKFQAYPCGSLSDYKAGRCQTCGRGCSYMGYHAPSNSTGLYVLNTGAT